MANKLVWNMLLSYSWLYLIDTLKRDSWMIVVRSHQNVRILGYRDSYSTSSQTTGYKYKWNSGSFHLTALSQSIYLTLSKCRFKNLDSEFGLHFDILWLAAVEPYLWLHTPFKKEIACSQSQLSALYKNLTLEYQIRHDAMWSDRSLS
jgi:hypothetical protein